MVVKLWEVHFKKYSHSAKVHMHFVKAKSRNAAVQMVNDHVGRHVIIENVYEIDMDKEGVLY